MQIQEATIRQGTIEEFADHYGLVMEVHERRLPEGHPSRFYAHFHYCEVKEGAILASEYGNGSTKEQAIAVALAGSTSKNSRHVKRWKN